MAPKRKRTSTTQQSEPKGHTPEDDMTKHSLFTTWATQRGVEISSIKPAKLPTRGLGLVTTKPVKCDTRLLFVPEKAMFKPDARLLKRSSLQGASPQAQLAFSAMVKCQPRDGVFALWRATWPSFEDFKDGMPICWPERLRKHLPPSVKAPFERQEADYRRDLAAVRAALDEQKFSEHDFLYFWLIVNSRSFHWKPDKANAAGSMVMCPFIDYMNHGPLGTGCRVLQTGKGYEVVADRDYDANEEILATYGAHSNDKLLVHYGFILPTTPPNPTGDDSIRLDHLLLPELSSSVQSQLQDVGFLGGYALLPASNEVCFKTQVAVRAQILTCNEWEYFVANGEDLGSDVSGEVDKFVGRLLEKHREEAKGEVAALERLVSDSEHGDDLPQGGVTLLKLRWRQTIDAIDAFIDVLSP